MGQVLITGASGFIGKALAASLAESHDVVCMSRRDPGLGLPWVRGEFSKFDDLRQLDGYDFDGAVHLAAAMGGCTERDGMLVNVEGTRCLMHYLMDRGCRKFVLASSIAAAGVLSTDFRPVRVPIPDEHPCLARDAYGLSKYLMEEVTRYFQRRREEIDVINLRLSLVCNDDALPPPVKVCPLGQSALVGISVIALSDAVGALTLALESPHRPGVRILNASAPKAWAADPVADILSNWWGDAVDVSHFRQPGHEFDSLYDVRRIKAELGFVAKRLPASSS
ncbi:MAG: NAD(P)-dependent oxidoreductase [Planctomycetia bacterium]|nr:NAD(P)-dependent oxidoreductase [Planctomycetia bacterium]